MDGGVENFGGLWRGSAGERRAGRQQRGGGSGEKSNQPTEGRISALVQSVLVVEGGGLKGVWRKARQTGLTVTV